MTGPGSTGGSGRAEGTPPAAAGRPVSVFIVDDHEIVRIGLAELIAAQPDMVVAGSAATVTDAVPAVLAAAPDVALLDARLPDGSGVAVCREIRSARPDTRVVMLTSYDDDDEALFEAVIAGADGYLLKEVRGTALLDAIRAVAAGRSLLDPRVVDRVFRRLREDAGQRDEVARLSDRDLELLGHLAAGMSNREIAQAMYLGENTVKNYVSRLLAKLGMQRRSQAAVYGAQLRRPGGPPPR